MTDAKSEGPYKVVNKEAECYSFSVIGPGVDWPDRAYEGTAKRICEIANTAHAEGRKSMEKELEELYKIASELCIERNNLYGFETDGILDFAAYKKLRGIE